MYFWHLQFSRKMNEQIRLYYYGTSNQLFSFVCWKNLKTPKIHFEINLPLTSWDSILSNIFRNFRSIETRTMLTHKFLQQLLMRRKYNLPIHTLFSLIPKNSLKKFGPTYVKEWCTYIIISVRLWNLKDVGSSEAGILPKNQHTQRKKIEKIPSLNDQ